MGIEGTHYTMQDGEPIFTDYILNNPDGLSPKQAVGTFTLSLIHICPGRPFRLLCSVLFGAGACQALEYIQGDQLGKARVRNSRTAASGSVFSTRPNTRPVSYTHLDVYKRQCGLLIQSVGFIQLLLFTLIF